MGDETPYRPLVAGEQVLFVDGRGRRYLVELVVDGEFHTHSGIVDHNALIGSDEGGVVRSNRGARYEVWRPTLADFVLSMPRGAQVIYPKDLGPILMHADIFAGARVFESGLGSGALSMALLRAGAIITGYELRPDFHARARRNVERFLGADALDRYLTHERSSYEGIDERGLDRVVLDLPEPWQVVPHAAQALRPGGLILSYSPSVVQVVTVHAALVEHGFAMIDTVEVIQRAWHVEDPAVRPVHRMQGHTGFLTVARLARPEGDRVGGHGGRSGESR
jgi:tRNA (adenine57-N1/adenine58-N1)-methyltransferase